MNLMKIAAILILFLSILYIKTTVMRANNSSKVQSTTIKELNNVVSYMDLVFVEGGSFSMGSSDGASVEQPVHNVQVDSFYISKYEVIQNQWKEIMGTNPTLAKGTGEKYPIYNITWNDAVDFCNKLSIREGLTPCYSGSGAGVECNFSANGYRLPTEAEWEYAARGGKKSQNQLYAGSNNEAEVGWSSENSDNTSHEVGLKAPNELGIYDMSGNLWEWCWDWYEGNYYASSPSRNPTGPSSGIYRVLRGGGWGINAYGLRCANRYYGAHRSDNGYGFRCVRKG